MGFLSADTWTVTANRQYKYAKLKRKEQKRHYRELKRRRRKRWGSPL